ncbi:hypothetical protein DSO57_1000638 [Entomophthora muscae]|uniref:Uncharacterized protein n=1 Tax=Entomophthora muscae TaxID=34485 RepID=A0ACC2S0H4_9FUNG|nr:hypothetical protein DSO57_1000638 [Entomophthora muscae]
MFGRDLLALTLLVSFGEAHSWLDCTDRRDDGSCGGFIRNFQGHDEQFSSYKIINHDPQTRLCEPRYQSRIKYSSKFPMAKVKAGVRLYFDYFENGHVNLDRLAPDMRPHPRHYAVYWTGIPSTGDFDDASQLKMRSDIHGRIPLEQRAFDDGECSDINYAGRLGPTPCIGGYTIPSGTPPGIYQLVWVWHYDRDLHGLGEEYTSCFDVEVLDDIRYQVHSQRFFPPYNPIDVEGVGESALPRPEQMDSTLSVPIDCSSPAYDRSIHACLKGGKVLCPVGNLVCNKGQCYSPLIYQCCFDTLLLPVNQACNIISNPFKRLARLKQEGF